MNPNTLENTLMYFTRKYDFCAAHRLYNPDLSDAENSEIFRECSYPNGHGHNYELEVTVAGPVDPKMGMVVDLWQLDQCVKKHLLESVDHKNMNVDVDFLAGKIPTAEVMVYAFWQQLKDPIAQLSPGAKLHKLKLLETRKNFAEYRGN